MGKLRRRAAEWPSWELVPKSLAVEQPVLSLSILLDLPTASEKWATLSHCAGQSAEAQDTQNCAQGHPVSTGRRLGSFWPFRHLCSQVRLGRWTLNRQYLGGLVIIATASVLQAKGREGLRVHRAG